MRNGGRGRQFPPGMDPRREKTFVRSKCSSLVVESSPVGPHVHPLGRRHCDRDADLRRNRVRNTVRPRGDALLIPHALILTRADSIPVSRGSRVWDCMTGLSPGENCAALSLHLVIVLGWRRHAFVAALLPHEQHFLQSKGSSGRTLASDLQLCFIRLSIPCGSNSRSCW